MRMTAVITCETFSDGTPAYVARCPELNISSQGTTIEDARANLQEAIEGFLEVASTEEIESALQEGGRAVALMVLEIEVPQTASPQRAQHQELLAA